MGLDMYAYSVSQGGAQDGEKIEIAYWRKHNRLHGWMEKLWTRKGKPNESISLQENYLIHQSPASFNCIPVELTLSDLEQLEAEVVNQSLPETEGMFFGGDSFKYKNDDGIAYPKGDYFHKETDVKFIQDARKEIFEGKKVYYNSWW